MTDANDQDAESIPLFPGLEPVELDEESDSVDEHDEIPGEY